MSACTRPTSSGTSSRPVLCNACHAVPGTQIHKTGVATAGTVALANLSTTGGIANATYATASGACSNVYCHGNFPGGVGAVVTATWTTAGTLSCTSCHGAPPALTAASHHPANATCATCHGTGYTASTVVASTHVDGATTLSRSGCTLCHGDLTQTGVAASNYAAAPGFNAAAADTTGATSAAAAGVGAHAAHLTGTRWRATVLACSECHTVPASGDVAHATGSGSGGARATIVFGTLARTGGITTATYAGSTTACGRERRGHLLQRLLPRQLHERCDHRPLPPGSAAPPQRPAAPATGCPPAERTRRAPPARTATPDTPRAASTRPTT